MYHPRAQGADSPGAVLRAAIVANPTLFRSSSLVPGSLNPALRALARALSHTSNTSCEVCRLSSLSLSHTHTLSLSLVERTNAYYLLTRVTVVLTNPGVLVGSMGVVFRIEGVMHTYN